MNPSALSARAASTSPKTSGDSRSLCPITSSLIQSVPKSSRAICAVVIASRAVWQPAVLGRSRTPSPSTRRRKSCPAPASRRRLTVATPAPEARNASARIAGEGYCAVPSISGEATSVP